MVPYTFVCRALVPARAYENHLFLAYANRCGREGELEYVGQSCIVAPDGADLARAGPGEELILADVDPAPHRSRRARTTPTSPTAGPSCTAASQRPGKPA